MFIWLGSGRARRRKVGSKGDLLDRAAHAGLPVPAGAILLDEFFQFCLENGLADRMGNRIVVPDTELLHNTLFHSVRLPRFNRPVAVRSAFSVGEDASEIPVDAFHARLNVDFTTAAETASSLAAVWTAASSRAAVIRADVLIMEMAVIESSGTALTRSTGEEDQINVESSRVTEALSLSLPQLRGMQMPGDDSLPFVRRVQMLLRGARRTFGAGDWLIEWADDGRVCRLLEVMPLMPRLSATVDPA